MAKVVTRRHRSHICEKCEFAGEIASTHIVDTMDNKNSEPWTSRFFCTNCDHRWTRVDPTKIADAAKPS